MEKLSAAQALLLITLTAGFAPQATAEDGSHRANLSDPYTAGSLCTKPDQILFSCPLARSKKIVSICAAGPTAPHRFYYAFGKADAIELTYPSENSDTKNPFTHSYLGYAAGFGGYAYSFVQNKTKYIVYSISGPRYDAGGVLVQKIDSAKAQSKLECAKGRIKEASDEGPIEETFKWPADDGIHEHGLPILN